MSKLDSILEELSNISFNDGGNDVLVNGRKMSNDSNRKFPSRIGVDSDNSSPASLRKQPIEHKKSTSRMTADFNSLLEEIQATQESLSHSNTSSPRRGTSKAKEVLSYSNRSLSNHSYGSGSSSSGHSSNHPRESSNSPFDEANDKSFESKKYPSRISSMNSKKVKNLLISTNRVKDDDVNNSSNSSRVPNKDRMRDPIDEIDEEENLEREEGGNYEFDNGNAANSSFNGQIYSSSYSPNYYNSMYSGGGNSAHPKEKAGSFNSSTRSSPMLNSHGMNKSFDSGRMNMNVNDKYSSYDSPINFRKSKNTPSNLSPTMSQNSYTSPGMMSPPSMYPSKAFSSSRKSSKSTPITATPAPRDMSQTNSPNSMAQNDYYGMAPPQPPSYPAQTNPYYSPAKGGKKKKREKGSTNINDPNFSSSENEDEEIFQYDKDPYQNQNQTPSIKSSSDDIYHSSNNAKRRSHRLSNSNNSNNKYGGGGGMTNNNNFNEFDQSESEISSLSESESSESYTSEEEEDDSQSYDSEDSNDRAVDIKPKSKSIGIRGRNRHYKKFNSLPQDNIVKDEKIKSSSSRKSTSSAVSKTKKKKSLASSVTSNSRHHTPSTKSPKDVYYDDSLAKENFAARTKKEFVTDYAEASMKKITTRIYIEDATTFDTVVLTSVMCSKDVIKELIRKNNLPDSQEWTIFELCNDYGVERPLKEWEIVTDVITSWDIQKTKNALILKKYNYYEFLKAKSAVGRFPSIHGKLYMETKPGKFAKKQFELRPNGLYYYKKKSSQETLLVGLANYDVYTLLVKMPNAPTDFSFAIKSTDPLYFFEDKKKYIFYLYTESVNELFDWVMSIRQGKTEKYVQEQHDKIEENSSSNIALSRSPNSLTQKTHRINQSSSLLEEKQRSHKDHQSVDSSRHSSRKHQKESTGPLIQLDDHKSSKGTVRHKSYNGTSTRKTSSSSTTGISMSGSRRKEKTGPLISLNEHSSSSSHRRKEGTSSMIPQSGSRRSNKPLVDISDARNCHYCGCSENKYDPWKKNICGNCHHNHKG